MSWKPAVIWATDEQEEERKTKWSNFFILINTNQAGDGEYDRSFLVTKLRSVLDRIFKDNKLVERIINVVDTDGKTILDPLKKEEEMKTIERVTIEPAVEVGPQIHRVHAHVIVMVQHKTRLQIDVPELRVLVRELSVHEGEILFKNPLVTVSFVKDPLNAIRKYQRGFKKKMPRDLLSNMNKRKKGEGRLISRNKLVTP